MGLCNPPRERIDQSKPNLSKNNIQKPFYVGKSLEQRIASSRFKHRLYQFCEKFGNICSDQARQWVQSTYAPDYNSRSTNIDGAKSQRNNRQQLLQLFNVALDKKWHVSVFLVSGVFEKQGQKEWVSWIYRLWIPDPNNQHNQLQFLYSAISVFDIHTGLWQKTDYTQMDKNA